MARDKEDGLNEDSRADADFDQFFGQFHPNPNRVGCPPADVLRALARKERRIDDPGYEHLEGCSECYREFRALQQGFKRTAARWWIAAAAVAILTGGTAIFFWSQQSGNRQGDEFAENRPADVAAVLDLRPFIITRGGEQSDRVQPLRLRQAELNLEILLPIGFEPGKYDLRIVDGSLNTVASREVEAAIENQTVKARTNVDLRDLAPGSYQLAIRVPGEEWHLYPAKVE